MSAMIQLTPRGNARASLEDVPLLREFRWHLHDTGSGKVYARGRRSYGERWVYMHRLVTAAQPGQVVDHINGDSLDNRRENLRFCTLSQNSRNRIKSVRATSRFMGVSWNKRQQKWVAQIKLNDGRHRCIGRYLSEVEAARAYDAEAVRVHGEFAKLNFPEVAA